VPHLPGAHDKTFDQGEITVLDPGGYGAVTITKSLSIINDGVGEAGTLVSGGATGITITAPNAHVSLRGLTIQGIGFGGGNGISVTKAAAVTISKCVIRNLTETGLLWGPDATSNSMSRLAISDTLVADNGQYGITLSPTDSAARYITLSRVEMYQNSLGGILANGRNSQGFMSVVVSDSAANKNGTSGFNAISDATHATVNMLVVRSSSSENSVYGFLNGDANNNTGIGDSIVANNGFGAITGSGFSTFGDNASTGNNNDAAGANDLGSLHAKF